MSNYNKTIARWMRWLFHIQSIAVKVTLVKRCHRTPLGALKTPIEPYQIVVDSYSTLMKIQCKKLINWYCATAHCIFPTNNTLFNSSKENLIRTFIGLYNPTLFQLPMVIFQWVNVLCIRDMWSCSVVTIYFKIPENVCYQIGLSSLFIICFHLCWFVTCQNI